MNLVQVDSVLPELQAYLAPAGQGKGGDMQTQLLPPNSPFRALLDPALDTEAAEHVSEVKLQMPVRALMVFQLLPCCTL